MMTYMSSQRERASSRECINSHTFHSPRLRLNLCVQLLIIVIIIVIVCRMSYNNVHIMGGTSEAMTLTWLQIDLRCDLRLPLSLDSSTIHIRPFVNELIAQSHDTAQLNKFATIYVFSPARRRRRLDFNTFRARCGSLAHITSSLAQSIILVTRPRWLYSTSPHTTLIASFAILLVVFFLLLRFLSSLSGGICYVQRQPQPPLARTINRFDIKLLLFIDSLQCSARNGAIIFNPISPPRRLDCLGVNPNRRHTTIGTTTTARAY